jgi:hypothetical protein
MTATTGRIAKPFGKPLKRKSLHQAGFGKALLKAA